MIAAGPSKPPRPCSEYNIFFQLERAYILQVLLDTKPALNRDDPAYVFHPLQPSYAGYPPLPRRYAALVLPYDWHLPGKEKRRKRKHRKSHGAIGFHDLSKRIVEAWKVVDDDVKAYCARVGALGMARYRATMREWKRRAGPPGESGQSDPSIRATRVEIDAALREDPAVIANEGAGDLSRNTQTTETLLPNNIYFQSTEQCNLCQPCNPVVLQPTTQPEPSITSEKNQTLEGDIDSGGGEPDKSDPLTGITRVEIEDASREDPEVVTNESETNVEGLSRNTQTTEASTERCNRLVLPPIASPEPSVTAETNPTSEDDIDWGVFVNIGDEGIDSILSSRLEQGAQERILPTTVTSIGPVDIEDSEIIAMWNDAEGNEQRCHDGTFSGSVVARQPFGNEKSTGKQFQSMFGHRGYAKTMREMHRMSLALEQQRTTLDTIQRVARGRSIVARSA